MRQHSQKGFLGFWYVIAMRALVDTHQGFKCLAGFLLAKRGLSAARWPRFTRVSAYNSLFPAVSRREIGFGPNLLDL